MNRLCHPVVRIGASILAGLTATCWAGGDLTPLSPTHARLLSGRELFIDADGAVHVRIAPAPVVRLTHDLLPVTFAAPASEQEALEIAEFPHAGAIVQSEKVLNDIVSLLEGSGLTQTRSQTHDIDSFVFSKGMEFGEKVTKRDGGFRVTFAALVSNLAYMGQGLKITKFDYDFAKDGSARHS